VIAYDAQGRMTTGTVNRETRFSSLGEEAKVCVAHLDPPGKVGRDRACCKYSLPLSSSSPRYKR